MIHLGVIWLSLFTAGAPQSQLWAPKAALPLNATEQVLIDDASDGDLEDHSLLKASLIAAGYTNPSELSLLQLQFNQLASRIDEEEAHVEANAALETQTTRAKHLLKEMHRVVLTGNYEASCSDLRKTILSGQYNCVTATIVYQILSRRHDINSHAVAVPAHVFCQLDQPEIDVQTTCATWLKPGKGRENADETLGRRVLSDVELVAKIYYNRGVLRLHEGNFAEAIRVLRLSLLLDRNDSIANSNLLAAINNWSLAEANDGRYSSASELLSIGRSLNADYAPLAANDLHIHQRWVQSLCRDGRYRFAMVVLDEGMRRRPAAKLFDDGRYVVLRMWATEAWTAGRIEDGFAVFDQGSQLGQLSALASASWDSERLHEAKVAAATAGAAKLVGNGRRATAVRLLRQAHGEMDDERVKKMLAHLTNPES